MKNWEDGCLQATTLRSAFWGFRLMLAAWIIVHAWLWIIVLNGLVLGTLVQIHGKRGAVRDQWYNLHRIYVSSITPHLTLCGLFSGGFS